MIELDVTKSKNFKFDINIDGIATDVLEGFLRLEISGVEYGFPAVVSTESISIDIPSLKSVLNREIKNGEKINARLDITGDGYYMKPWTEEIVVKSSVVVEAKLVDSDKPTVRLKESKPITESRQKKGGVGVKPSTMPNTQPPAQKVIREQKLPPITKELIYKYMAQNGTNNETIQNLLYEQASMKIGDDPKTLLKFFIGFYKKKNEEKE